MIGEILNDAGDLVLKSPDNEVLALGECVLLSEFTQLYGRMPLHAFSYRFMSSVKNTNIVMLYQRVAGVPDVAVGFMMLGFLTPQVAQLYVARNRDLCHDEIIGGEELWVLDMATPFGHYDAMKALLDKAYPTYENIWGLRDGSRTKFPNSAYVAPPAP